MCLYVDGLGAYHDDCMEIFYDLIWYFVKVID